MAYMDEDQDPMEQALKVTERTMKVAARAGALQAAVQFLPAGNMDTNLEAVVIVAKRFELYINTGQ